MIGLLEPINNRITDPRYYLNTPHQGKQTPRVSCRGREGCPKSERFPQHLPHRDGGAERAESIKGVLGFSAKLPLWGQWFLISCPLSCCHPGESGTAQPEAAAGELASKLSMRETCTGPQRSFGGYGLVIPSWGHWTGTIAQLSLTAHC